MTRYQSIKGVRYKRPCYWGYDTGKRCYEVICHCGKHLFSQDAYEQHMVAKHPSEVRRLKKCGCWQQKRLDGWGSNVKKVRFAGDPYGPQKKKAVYNHAG